MKRVLDFTALVALALFLFVPTARAQGVLDPNLYSLAPEVLPAVALEPLAFPQAAVAPAAAPGEWLPRLPLIRSTLQFRYFYASEESAGPERARPNNEASLSSFDIPNARFYFTGEAFRGLSYQVAFRISGDNANEFLKDAYFDWKPNAQFAGVPSTFGILMGKMPDTQNPARASSHVNRLQGAEAPFSIGPPVLSSVRIVAMRPYMSFWGDRIQANYQITPAGAASGTTTNTKNDWRHTIGFAVSPLGRFPIGPATENDLRRSPFNVNLGYGYTRTYEALRTAAVTNVKDTDTNYHAADAVAVWQGLFLAYKFVTREGVEHLGTTRFNSGGSAHRATVSYAIKTSWGDLVPWYQYNLVSVDDRRVLRNGTGGTTSGALIDIGGPANETISGSLHTAQFREHWIGLNLHIAGEALAIKPYVRIDTLRDKTFFVVQLQHQFFFNPEGKYR